MPCFEGFQYQASIIIFFSLQDASHVVKSSSPKVIDIASGAGEPGISLAKHFSSGTILITDIAPGMVEQAKKMCAEADVKNVRCSPPHMSRAACV